MKITVPRLAKSLAISLALSLSLASPDVFADITIGVTLPLTGPTAGLGIPVKKGLALWPTTIGGEKINMIVLDDGGDATQGVKNARRFVDEDHVDIIIGSVATPVGVAIADVASQAHTVQLALSPVDLPEGKGEWTFRLAHSTAVMANALVAHMQKHGVKTLGFIGYTDAYGESWLRDISKQASAAGITMVDTERFARADTSVAGQALKLTVANPDAILVVASGSGAAMPEIALSERGYKGVVYQTHAAASHDLMRVGGKDVEGALVVSGPAVVAEQLPASNPSKPMAMEFVTQYEKAYGPDSRNQFAGHIYDTLLLLNAIVPQALKKAQPGTAQFRAALKDAIEHDPPLAASQGVLTYSPTDHYGFPPDTGVILKVVNGEFQLQPK
jgi:branched-chain amino acid transport system substrate-binding protein